MWKKKLIEKRKNKKSLVVCVYIYIYIYVPNMRNGRKNRLPNIFISYLVFFCLIFIPSTQQFHNISKLAYHLTHGPTIYNLQFFK